MNTSISIARLSGLGLVLAVMSATLGGCDSTPATTTTTRSVTTTAPAPMPQQQTTTVERTTSTTP